MNGQLEMLREREKRYETIYKKVLFHMQLLKEASANEQKIKDTTLDSIDMAIKLNNVREQIYQIESDRLISKQVMSAEEEKMRISALVDLASKRKAEIAELFSNQDEIASPELEKQTNEFILYSDKLKIIDSYLEMKEKEKLLTKENEILTQKEIDLKTKMKNYEQENTTLIRNLDKNVDKAMSLLGFSLQDEEAIVFEAVSQLRNEELNKLILENMNQIEESSIQEEHRKVIQNIKRNRKKDMLDYYHAYEKYYIFQVKQMIVGIQEDDFSKTYDNLLTILSLLNERLKLRKNKKIEEKDPIDFFYENVVNTIHKLEAQISDRTTLDSVIIKKEENNKNIAFYRNLINNSNDIKQVLGEISEEEIEYDEELPEEVEVPQTILEEQKEVSSKIMPEELIIPKTEEVILDKSQEENDREEEVISQESDIEKPIFTQEKLQNPIMEEVTTQIMPEEPTIPKAEEVILDKSQEENDREEEVISQKPDIEKPIFTQEELQNPIMEEVTTQKEDPNTIISVDDASNELKTVVQTSYLKFKNWFNKNWQRINKIPTTPGNTRKLK